MTASLAGSNSSRKASKPSPSGDDDPLPAPGPVTVCGRCLAPLDPAKPHPQPCGWAQYKENGPKGGRPPAFGNKTNNFRIAPYS